MVFKNKQKNKSQNKSILDLLEIEKKEEQHLFEEMSERGLNKLEYLIDNVVPTNQQEFDNDFQNLLDNSYINEVEGELALDVYEEEGKIVVRAPIAGVELEDLDINFSQGVLTIKGERKSGQLIKDDKYFIKECFWGKFSRSILLPDEIDSGKIKAHIKNGILSIVLPKLELPNNVNIEIKKL